MAQTNFIERAAYIMEQFKEGFLETAGNRIVFSGLVITRLDLAQGDSGQLTASCRFFVFFSMAAGAAAAAAVVAPPRWACYHREYDQYWCGPCRSWTDFRYDHTHFGGTHPPACFLLLLPDSPFDGTKFYPVTCVGPFLVGAQCVCVCVPSGWRHMASCTWASALSSTLAALFLLSCLPDLCAKYKESHTSGIGGCAHTSTSW